MDAYFDSRSWIDDIHSRAYPANMGRASGQRTFVACFRKGLSGEAGQEAQFSFVFPEDYYQEELRDKEVRISQNS